MTRFYGLEFLDAHSTATLVDFMTFSEFMKDLGIYEVIALGHLKYLEPKLITNGFHVWI